MIFTSLNKSKPLFWLTGLLFFCGCQDADVTKAGGRPRNNSGPKPETTVTPSSTPSPTPTSTPTFEDGDTNGNLTLFNSPFGATRNVQQQGDLTLETEQGNPIDAKNLLSVDGSLELTVKGGKSTK